MRRASQQRQRRHFLECVYVTSTGPLFYVLTAVPRAVSGGLGALSRRYTAVAAEPGKEIYCQNGDTGVSFRLCGNNITGNLIVF
jgi:hypothetical protein